MSPTAALGLGSNVGDRLAHLTRAVRMLAAEPGVRPTRCSRIWETEPVGGPAQPDFLNLVLLTEVDLTPHELLAACHRVEAALDRVRDVRWGPRTIDVDVLLVGDLTIDDPELVVPHPRMHERAFVLMPLLEVDPEASLPDGRRLADLPLGPHAAGGVRPVLPPLPLS